jgi:hypothetical protein
MSTAKHTPGPWHWPHDSNSLCPVNPDPEHSTVSEILYAEGGHGFLGRSNNDTLAELEADRRLIAAAPELLASLREVLTIAQQCIDTSRLIRCERQALADAEAAIAKATGCAA